MIHTNQVVLGCDSSAGQTTLPFTSLAPVYNKWSRPAYLDLSINLREAGGLAADDSTVLLLNTCFATDEHSLGAFSLGHSDLSKV